MSVKEYVDPFFGSVDQYDSLDMVIDRYGNYNQAETYRVLKSCGVFISQQVGAENDRGLAELPCENATMPFLEQYADETQEKFHKAGFSILPSQECFCPIWFYDMWWRLRDWSL